VTLLGPLTQPLTPQPSQLSNYLMSAKPTELSPHLPPQTTWVVESPCRSVQTHLLGGSFPFFAGALERRWQR